MEMEDVLELTMGGRTIGSEQAITFFASVRDMLDGTLKTESFKDQYEYALNRVRYLARLDIPKAPKEDKGRFTSYNCGRCGSILSADNYKFCPACGQRIRW